MLQARVVIGVAVSAEHTKALFIQLGFAGSVDTWCSKYYPEQIEKLTLKGTPAAWIYEFQDAITFVLKHIARAHPDALRDADGSESTLAFHFYASMECATRSKMITATQGEGDKYVSLEHDCLVAECAVAEQTLKAINTEVAPLVVVCKAIPKDPLYEAKRRFPDLDWEARSWTPLDEFVGLWELCKMHIENDRVHQNTITFAEFAAGRLDSACVVPCSDGEKRQCFELYNGKGWTFHNAADMKAVGVPGAACRRS